MRLLNISVVFLLAFLLGACGRVEATRPVEGGTAEGSAAPGSQGIPVAGGAPSAPTKVEESQLVTTASGLKYADLTVGDGAEATVGKTASVHYTGWLQDGTQFDSSLDSGTPFDVQLGSGSVIPGWEEGLQGMKVGGKRQLIIPPDLGYGANAQGPIPANSTLIFEVELLDVK